MNIIILGAGAIGSFYGAKLSQLNDVTLVGRKQHIDAINKKGLTIGGLKNNVYKLRAQEKIKEVKDNTIILLATKAYDSQDAVNKIKNLVKKSTIILCLQNGLYTENIAKKIIGKKCVVLRAVTSFGAAFLEPGIVRFNNKGCTMIEKGPKSNELSKNFTKCGLRGVISENIKYDIWKKLIVNCVVNPLTAILRVKNREISDERLNPLNRLIINECLMVAKKDGIDFKAGLLKEISEGIKGSENISSMLQDLLRGRKTEISYLNGAVVGLGRKYGIECPVNKRLVAIVKQLESHR